MKNTTFTFSTLRRQTPVELIEDPSKPNWEDLLSPTASDEGNDDEEMDLRQQQANKT